MKKILKYSALVLCMVLVVLATIGVCISGKTVFIILAIVLMLVNGLFAYALYRYWNGKDSKIINAIKM